MIALALLALLLALPLPAQAAPAPIVFDFEDGLQGWELGGSAQRVQTQILGGEWAILGDGLIDFGAMISIEMDLTDIGSISVEQFFTDGSGEEVFFFRDILQGIIFPAIFRHVFRLDVVEAGNPSLRSIDVSGVTGVTRFGFSWGPPLGWCCEDLAAFEPLPVVAFIDNITFHPVPEPVTLALLAVSLVALVITRRRVV